MAIVLNIIGVNNINSTGLLVGDFTSNLPAFLEL